MRIDDLREYIELGNTLNFTEAAKNSYITQPALSKHIANMESELGTKLFTRTKQGVALTFPGEILLDAAKRMLSVYDAALNDIEHIKQGQGLTLRVGILTGAFSRNASLATGQFSRMYPGLDIHYDSSELGELTETYKAKDLDILLGVLPKTSKYVHSNDHVWMPFSDDGVVAMLNKEHPLARRKSITVSNLANYDNAVPDSRMLGKEMTEYFSAAGLLNLRNARHTISNFMNVIYYVKDMNCAATVMTHIEEYFDDPDIRYVPIVGLENQLERGALWHREDDSDLIRSFVSLFKELDQNEE